MADKDRKIISNDDGWIMSNMTGPVTPQTIKERMIDTYSGVPIGTMPWCVGNSEAYEYETEVGERTGDGYTHFADECHAWQQRNHSDRINIREHHALPVFMEETQSGGGSALFMDIADDVDGARSAGPLGGCTLGLGFDHINDDELDVPINGEPVPWDKRRVSQDGWGYTVFDGTGYHTTVATERVEMCPVCLSRRGRTNCSCGSSRVPGRILNRLP